MFPLWWSGSSSWVVYVVWYQIYRNVTLCHGVGWDLGFENVKHGLISYIRILEIWVVEFTMLHFWRPSQSVIQGECIVYMTSVIFVVVSVAQWGLKVKIKDNITWFATWGTDGYSTQEDARFCQRVKELTRFAKLVWHQFPMTSIVGGRFQIRLLNFLFAWPPS